MSQFLDTVDRVKQAARQTRSKMLRAVDDEYLYTVVVIHTRTITARTRGGRIQHRATLRVTIDLIGKESVQDIADSITRALNNAAGRKLQELEVAS